MKLPGATWLVVLVSLTLLFTARRASALVMVMEGYARATLVLAADQTIICSSQVSGAEEELFALDAATGRVVWREKGKRFYPVALPDKAGAFYVFDDNVLQKRGLSTGALFWESRLNTITQQNTPPPRSMKELFDDLLDKLPFRSSQTRLLTTIRLNPWTGSPSYYHYRPFLSDDALFVFREASGGGGCVRYHCFNDWIRLNPKSGQQTDGGSGALLGETRGSAVFKNDFATYCVKKGRLSQIQYPGVTNRLFSSSLHGIGREHYSWRDKCIFTDAMNGLQTVFVFDGQKSEGYSFVIPEPAAFQTDWVLLDQYVLRYSQCVRYEERVTTKADAFFELYDLRGQFVARKEAQMPDRNWYVRFLGISAGGKVYFDWQERISLEIPSLKFGSVPRSLTANRATRGVSHLLPGSNRLYEIHGGTWLSKMDQPQLPHDLLITASDIETGATLWQHTEQVMMKKVP